MPKETNSLPKQGIDGCTFTILSKSLFRPIGKIPLIGPNGNEYGMIRSVGTDYILFVCPPKYVRETNEYPFGLSDIRHINNMRRDIECQLKKIFPRGYCSEAKKIEINMTDTMVGNCQCKHLFGMLCDSLLHSKEQNLLYVTSSKETLVEKDIPGFVSRTIGNQWKLKCYDKQRQLETEMNIQIEEPLIRMEFILLSRKIDNLFGKKNDLSTIFSSSSLMLLINEYKSLMDNLCENYVKKYMYRVREQLHEDLRVYKSPTDVYCLRKEIIYDREIFQRALKAWYRKQGKTDNTKQVLYGINQKFGLPCNTLDTIRKFHRQC